MKTSKRLVVCSIDKHNIELNTHTNNTALRVGNKLSFQFSTRKVRPQGLLKLNVKFFKVIHCLLMFLSHKNTLLKSREKIPLGKVRRRREDNATESSTQKT